MDGRTDVLWAIVTTYHLRLAATLDDLFKLTNHPFGGQREVNLHADCFSIEVVNYVEQS